jgi:hypothetical protein
VSEPVVAAAYGPGSNNWAAVTGTQLLRSGAEPLGLSIDKAAAVTFADTAVLVAGQGGVQVVDGAAATTVACDCTATSLERLAGTNVFRLTGLTSEKLAIYDGSNGEPKISYLPNEGGRR